MSRKLSIVLYIKRSDICKNDLVVSSFGAERNICRKTVLQCIRIHNRLGLAMYTLCPALECCPLASGAKRIDDQEAGVDKRPGEDGRST